MFRRVVLFLPLPFLYAVDARAQCEETTIDPASPTIVCDGVNIGPIEDDRDGLAIFIEENAELTADTQVDLVVVDGDDVQITNAGSVGDRDPSSMLIDDAFRVGGDGFRFVNTQTGVISHVSSAFLSFETVGGSVLNEGLISTVGTSLIVDGENHVVTNETTGVIISERGTAVSFVSQPNSNSATLINRGHIEALDERAVTGASFFTLMNEGTIRSDTGSSTGEGVGFGEGSVTNSGEIFASGTAISLTRGEIRNSGLIESDRDSAIFVFAPSSPEPGDNLDTFVINNGDIIANETAITVQGGFREPNLTQQHVQHIGGLISGGIAAVALEAGDDSFAIGNGAALIGDVLLEDGDDALLIWAGTGNLDASIFEGGAGEDTITFNNGVGLGGFLSMLIADDIFKISFRNGDEDGAIKVRGFEFVNVAGQAFSFDAFVLQTSEVPLPAGMFLFLTGAVVLVRRRRAQPRLLTMAAAP
ncbi:MAG: hypothetical protein AAGJ87_10215 [Pseudomonadota bacterium]